MFQAEKEVTQNKEKGQIVQLFSISKIPIIEEGDDIGLEIYLATQKTGFSFKEKDILIVAQKIVSKAEGRSVDLNSVIPSPEALELSKKSGKPAKLCEIILKEARRIIKVEPGIIVTEHRLGYVGTSAGVDRSNTGSPSGEKALLLPVNPDKSARKIRSKIKELSGKEVGVIISDSGGRVDRLGSRAEAIGVAGIPPLLIEDKKDLFGRPLHTEIALSDSLATAAGLLMGESNEGYPVVVIRGVNFTIEEDASIQTILKRGDSALQ